MKLPVIILAGGLGTRLKDLTEKIPKALIEVAGKPFIFHQLELLKNQEVAEVVISINHFGDQIIREVGNGEKFNLKITYHEDGEEPLGTGGAVKKISSKIKGYFFLMYGDSYLNIDFSEVLNSFKLKQGPLMVIYENNNKLEKSNVLLKSNNISYSKENVPKNCQHIDYGLSIFHSNNFKDFNFNSFDLSTVQESFSEKNQLQYHLSKDRFYEIGSPKGLNELENFLK
tara:strand:- start:37 stop:720 length:684 start_codon:yes stop_codon:yes gene_type:complete